MAAERILVVDDDKLYREYVEEILCQEGYDVVTTGDAFEALDILKKETFHVILSDLKMPQMDGLEFLRKLKSMTPSTVGIICTAYATVETAVEAMKIGVYDYITKPVRRDELLVVLQRALEYHRKQLKEKYKFDNIISSHEKMQAVFAQVEKLANVDSTVLILGESGTGKELIARALHYKSDRQDKPLIPINCGAIPAELLESELFGHEKGAFTGAVAQRIGRFELANGGTIFLDEIAEMHPTLQVKLLRVLQEREFERIGGIKTIKVDVRVIAATNKNLENMVSQGQFRDDLYWRLNVIPLTLPPLRERLSDIALLVAYFIQRFNVLRKQNLQGITPEAMQALECYHWPGNVRELENVIERIVVLKGSGFITLDDLPENISRLAISKRTLSIDSGPYINIYSSKSMHRIDKLISLAASNDVPVLIEGEIGTGQELIAYTIFKRSEKYTRIFIPFNCSGISEEQMAEELFGNEYKDGLFHIASGGTLFLNEVTELPASVQSKLLQAIQFGEIQLQGVVKHSRVQFRLIVATTKFIEQEVRDKNFRLDLYFRLALLRILLPSLREHPDDIPSLAEHFLRHYYPSKRFSKNAVKKLQRYSYPGNLQELELIIRRMALVAKGQTILEEDIEFDTGMLDIDAGGLENSEVDLWTRPLVEAVGAFEEEYLERCLKRAGGVVSHAAKLAGIHRVTFMRKLQRQGIRIEED